MADANFVNRADIVGGPQLTTMNNIESQEITWLWPGRVPMGRITLLVGKPGEGKSYVSLDMAARISTGTPWPDGADCPRGSVILCSAEDDPADVIRPRLDAHRADVSRIVLLSGVKRLIGDEVQEGAFTLHDVACLEEALQQVPDCRMVVIDPIGSFIGGSTDAHRDNEVRAVLTPIARLAEKYGAAVLMVAHRRKGTSASADETAMGSRAFTGIARAVWHISRDPNVKTRRLMLPGKNNLAVEGSGLAFTITGQPVGAVVWERDPVRMSADEAMADENSQASGRDETEQSAAIEWLQSELADLAEHPVKDIRAAANEAGIGWRSVQRASAKLRVCRHRETFGGRMAWRLPKPASVTSESGA